MSQINLTPLVQQQSTSRLKFIEKYWFSNLQMITVRNPMADDIVFMHEMRTYGIRANSEARFPGSIANLYLDQLARVLAQADNDLGAISDPAKCGAYYDQLIVHREESAPEYSQEFGFSTIPPKPSSVVPSQPFQSEDFKPPIEDVKPLETAPEPPKKMQAGERRSFNLGDDVFETLMTDYGETHTKNGVAIGTTEFAKAVSML